MTLKSIKNIDSLNEKAKYVASIYNRLANGLHSESTNSILVPGFDVSVGEEVSTIDLREAKQTIVNGINHILSTQNENGHNVPNELDIDTRNQLADLFVEATVKQDYGKRTELIEKIESLNIKFESKLGSDSPLIFWSGDYENYKNLLNEKLNVNNKQVTVFEDVSGFDFMYKLSIKLAEYSNSLSDDNKKIINQGVNTLTGFMSSIYAVDSQDTIYALSPNGIKINNYFWKVELPVLRELQKDGKIGEIRILFDDIAHYKDKPIGEIGSPITSADVPIKIQFFRIPKQMQARFFARHYQQLVQNELLPKLFSLNTVIQDYKIVSGNSNGNFVTDELQHKTSNYIKEISEIIGLDIVSQVTYWDRFLGAKDLDPDAHDLLSIQQFSNIKFENGYENNQQSIREALIDLNNILKSISKLQPIDLVDLRINSDFINKNADNLKNNLLPFNRIRNDWNIDVNHDIPLGKVEIILTNGRTTNVQVDNSKNQREQLSVLQKFILEKYDQKTIPSYLEMANNKIQVNDGKIIKIFKQINGSWSLDSSVQSIESTLSTKNKFLYGDSIQSIADKQKTVLVIRAPNEHSIGLLQEGYASKNFHIKAKSSAGGPTAGFVVDDPNLSKVRGKSSEVLTKQQKAIDAAILKGAEQVQLELSDERVQYLESNQLIETISVSDSTRIIKGHYNDNSSEYFRSKVSPFHLSC